MNRIRRDETLLMPRWTGGLTIRGQRKFWALAALAAGALFPSPVRGQQPAPAPVPGQPPGQPTVVSPVPESAKFTARIKDMTTETQRIRIPLNRSVIIETTLPVKTVQSVSPAIAVVQSISPTQVLISGASYGETQVIVWAEDGRQNVFSVSVELDLQALQDALRRIDAQSKVDVSSIQGHIVLTGTVSSAAAAERMLSVTQLFIPRGSASLESVVQNHLQVAGEQQVLLRCTVAEVSRQASRQLGINGFLAGENFRDAFVVNQIGGINPINIGAAADANVRANVPFLTGQEGIPISGNTTLSLGFPRVQMQVFLQALADNSLLKVLAEPNLVAISGETATFLAGGEFPYPVPQGGAAANAITIEFKEFGIALNFTPVVLGQQRIRLRIAPEISALDFNNAVQIQGTLVPGLTQRKTETTVEIGNGATLAIAGLLSEEVRGVASRIPGIGDVPVLGALFRSTEYQKRLTELVVLVTPEIVAPMDPQQVPPVPGQNMGDPNDWQFYGMGTIEGDPLPDDTGPADALRTEVPKRVAPTAPLEQAPLRGPFGTDGGDAR